MTHIGVSLVVYVWSLSPWVITRRWPAHAFDRADVGSPAGARVFARAASRDARAEDGVEDARTGANASARER